MLICNVCHEEHERNEQNHIYSYVDEPTEFWRNVTEELHCSICKDPIQQPTDTACEHTFCGLCIKQCINMQGLCPVCREPLLFSDLKRSTLLVRNILNKLRVSCPVCQEILGRQQLEPHLAKDCPNVEVRCKYVYNGCIIRLPRNIIKTHNAVCEFQHKPAGTELAPVRDFPNMFHSDVQFVGLLSRQLVNALLTSPDVKNLYMFCEAMDYRSNWQLLTGDTLQQVIETKQARGWCTVEPNFVDGLLRLTSYHPDTLALIKSCKELVSATDHVNVKIVCDDYTNRRNLVVEENMYKFYYQHPNVTTCSNPTQCGFIVKVSPLTIGKPNSFNIQLVTDPVLYPDDIHCHSSVMSLSAENMHLVVERYSVHYENWHNKCISWLGRPVYGWEYEESEVWWGKWECGDWMKVRLAVYYNFTKI